jgi:hypothetical protein
VRPHPQRLEEWSDPAALEGLRRAGAVFWGANPVDEASRSDYYDSLFHADAVVGLNTSAMVEAAIVDRPVLTLLLPEFHENQEGTFHFHHLLRVGGGFLHVARSLDAHVEQIALLFDGQLPQRNGPFVQQFIRPRGRSIAATATFVDALEQELRTPGPRPRPAPAWVLLLRPLVYALVLAGRVPVLERIYWNPLKRREWARKDSSAGNHGATGLIRP